jgi:hypothetical protein
MAAGSASGGARALARAVAAVLLAAVPAAFDPSRSDRRAIEVADAVLRALGGAEAWEKTRFIHFVFAFEAGGARKASRTHLWDRYAGRLRYERTDPDGRPLVVLLDANTRRGEAYRDGAALPPAEAKALLEEAYEAWINDTYWLLMPYKMKDPGVRLSYDGEVSEGGATYDRVLLRFDGVGLTPGDRYWAYVDRATGLMRRWAYVLEGQPAGSQPTIWEWKGWARHGGILLAPEKVRVGGPESARIVHPLLAVYDALPEECFTRPDPLPASLR